ncbi:hypothetical protein AB0A77_05765 [Streptomyces varsoviensis]|uniref:hypothetical protein n=1 Tax=Streptomyces varsoviensis TaxID=67373 RepID=UPI0033F5742D
MNHLRFRFKSETEREHYEAWCALAAAFGQKNPDAPPERMPRHYPELYALDPHALQKLTECAMALGHPVPDHIQRLAGVLPGNVILLSPPLPGDVR